MSKLDILINRIFYCVFYVRFITILVKINISIYLFKIFVNG